MKTKYRFAIVLSLILFGGNIQKICAFDGYFSSYSGSTSWLIERVYLDDFATFLSKFPEHKGYLVFFVGKKDNYKNVLKRVNRAKKYVVNYRHVSASQIHVIYSGKQDKTEIILQPILPEGKPKFSDNDKEIF